MFATVSQKGTVMERAHSSLITSVRDCTDSPPERPTHAGDVKRSVVRTPE